MRDREHFKAYVYAKANAARAKRRKTYRLVLSGVAAFCVCVCIGSAVIFSELQKQAPSDAVAADAPMYEDLSDAAGADAAPAETAAVYGGSLDNMSDAPNSTFEEGECADSSLAEDAAEAPFLVKNFFFSVNACSPSDALISAAHCEVIENDAEKQETASSDRGTAPVRVGISASFVSKPTISDVTIDYGGEAITITIFADRIPSPFGSYLYYATESLDANRYTGQPIELAFKLASAENAGSDS